MSTTEPTATGTCRCGRIRFRVTGRPLVTMACHCTGCQRMTASAFSLSALYPLAAFAMVEGETVIGGMHSPDLPHHFCPHCMSWVFTRFSAPDEFVNVRATMLDNAKDFVPFVETCTAEKLPWAVTPAAHSFETFPPMERFPELMAEFAARR
ncbi:MAG: GFA family protein [Rhodobacteraceae bacterium]|nr:GFA family protein [Paracoccaceae bacterium]